MRFVGGPWGYQEDGETVIPYRDYLVSRGFSWPLDEEVTALTLSRKHDDRGIYVSVSHSQTLREELKAGEFRGAVYHWRDKDEPVAEQETGFGQFL